jgi:hypothetical protein
MVERVTLLHQVLQVLRPDEEHNFSPPGNQPLQYSRLIVLFRRQTWLRAHAMHMNRTNEIFLFLNILQYYWSRTLLKVWTPVRTKRSEQVDRVRPTKLDLNGTGFFRE